MLKKKKKVVPVNLDQLVSIWIGIEPVWPFFQTLKSVKERKAERDV